jgi:hypothetical protein
MEDDRRRHVPDDCPMKDQPVMQSTLVEAAREILQDKELMSMYWKGGFDAFMHHGGTEGKNWLGAKAWLVIQSSLVGFGLWLIYTFGAKK